MRNHSKHALSHLTLNFDPFHTSTPCFSLVDPSKETLEAGLSRELLEEVGVAIPISVADHAYSCRGPPTPMSASFSSHLMLHFYVKKMEEEQITEVERAAVSTATDHGHEVIGGRGCLDV